jgi:hypothetical protein
MLIISRAQRLLVTIAYYPCEHLCEYDSPEPFTIPKNAKPPELPELKAYLCNE